MDTKRFVRSLAICLLGSAVATKAATQPMPIPLGPALALNALPFLLLPYVVLSKSEAEKLQELEAFGHWDAVAEFAGKKLRSDPGQVEWHEVRARALVAMGRCADAIPDLQRALSAHAAVPAYADPVVRTGLVLAQCQLHIGDSVASVATLERLAAVAPHRWEPEYLLAWAYRHRGDASAAAYSLQRLRALHGPAADALQRYFTHVPAPEAGVPQRFLAQRKIEIGGRALVLPAGTWFEAGGLSHRMQASRSRSGISQDWERIEVVTTHAWAAANPEGAAARVAFSGNRVRFHGIGNWAPEDACAVRDALHVDRFGGRQDQPECLYVRRVDGAAAAGTGRWVNPFKHPPGTVAGPAYEVHYGRYALERSVAVTFLLPATGFEGDVRAVEWAKEMAARVRTLAERPHEPYIEALLPEIR